MEEDEHSDNNSSNDSTCVLYKDRPDWKDVTPIPQVQMNTEMFVSSNIFFSMTELPLLFLSHILQLVCDPVMMPKQALIPVFLDVDVMDYLRGIMRVNELSARALNLTSDAISMNPSNYTIWYEYLPDYILQ